MASDANLLKHLEGGGVLTSPDNMPARYRAELMRMLVSFVDSELAAAAGFAEIINEGPGIKERIAAARIVMEKTVHADRVLALMSDFEVSFKRYATYQKWSDRLDRSAPVGAVRVQNDMRLAVFNYPVDGWTDAVTMNLLLGVAVGVQLAEYATISYQPFALAIREIGPREAHHAHLAVEGVQKLLNEGNEEDVARSIAYWSPRVRSSFGADDSGRFDMLKSFGLRTLSNAELRARYLAETETVLDNLGLKAPAG